MRSKGFAASCVALLALFASGCASVGYKSVVFDVLEPAACTLPEWVDTVIVKDNVMDGLLVDSTLPPNDPKLKDIADYPYTYMSSVAAQQLVKSLNSTGYVVAVNGHRQYSSQEVADGMSKYGYEGWVAMIKKRELLDSDVDSILAGRPSSVILSLDKMNSCTTLRTAEREVDGESMLCATIIAATSARLTLVAGPNARMTATWRQDTLLFDVCGYTPHDVALQMPTIHKRYEEQARNTGAQLANEMVPAWRRVYRSIYVTNNRPMMAAGEWVDLNDWEKAKDLWQSVYQDAKSKPAERMRAAINYALALEREDDAVEAAMWVSRALDIYEALAPKDRNKLADECLRAKAMFGYLIERQHRKAELDKQMR